MNTIGLDISVLNDNQKTGISVYTYQLIDNLLKINKKDHFILFGIATFATFDYLSNLEFKKYPNVEMKIYKMPARVFRLGFISWQKLGWPVIDLLTGPVDLFHSFNWFFPPQKKGKKVATVFDLTSLNFPDWHQPKTTQLDKLRLTRIAEKADLTITISENSKKDFLKLSPKGKVEVVYPAVGESFKSHFPKKDTDQILKKYNLLPGYFLSVATLEPRKNLMRLIKAFLATTLETPLVLVGGHGWKNQEILDLVSQNESRIKLTGFVPDDGLPIIYSQASAFIYPSLYEGFGIPILEAFASGIPVICSNTSSLPEVAGKAALFIDPLNEKSIEDALVKISSNNVLRKNLIKLGGEQLKKFSWKDSAEKLNHLYEDLINTNQSKIGG